MLSSAMGTLPPMARPAEPANGRGSTIDAILQGRQTLDQVIASYSRGDHTTIASYSRGDHQSSRGAQGADMPTTRHGRILVCAHSNAAVDELLSRLLRDGEPSPEPKPEPQPEPLPEPSHAPPHRRLRRHVR